MDYASDGFEWTDEDSALLVLLLAQDLGYESVCLASLKGE